LGDALTLLHQQRLDPAEPDLETIHLTSIEGAAQSRTPGRP
jgi:hypothetical protein